MTLKHNKLYHGLINNRFNVMRGTIQALSYDDGSYFKCIGLITTNLTPQIIFKFKFRFKTHSSNILKQSTTTQSLYQHYEHNKMKLKQIFITTKSIISRVRLPSLESPTLTSKPWELLDFNHWRFFLVIFCSCSHINRFSSTDSLRS